jgi:hypothetical protein
MRRQCCLPMTEDPEASVLTARRAPQHVRLSSADDAYEHLCISDPATEPSPSPPYGGRCTVVSVPQQTRILAQPVASAYSGAALGVTPKRWAGLTLDFGSVLVETAVTVFSMKSAPPPSS